MRKACLSVLAGVAACGASSAEPSGAAPGDAANDAAPEIFVDGANGAADGQIDARAGEADARAGEADARAGEADARAGDGPRILFQCTAFAGGLCVMNGDGREDRTLHASGFAPRGLDDGTVLFHTAGYRVARWRADGSAEGAVVDLGEGAFPRRRPGRDALVFQCSGLGGGLCAMDLDGAHRTTIRAGGRVPDVDGGGALLFHSDAYRVIRRDPDGREQDLGDGAFATWAADGSIVFQCSGLDGGLCRMDRDGAHRAPVRAAGRVPSQRADGAIVFHGDDYRLYVDGTAAPLRDGANAVWWASR